MLAARRLAPHAIVGLWLAGWALLCNMLLLALAATSALQWLPDRQTGLGFVLDNRQRVEAAVHAYGTGEVRPDKYLAAIVGISNMREGVDLGVLSSAVGRRWRFIGVSGAGAGAASIVEHASIVSESDLRPDLVVLGITPQLMLEASNDAAPADTPATKAPLRERVRDTVRGSLWIVARRRDISVSTERTLLDLRRRLFEALEVRLETVDTQSPWRAMLRVMGSDRYPDEVLRKGIASAEARGTFDIASYRRDNLAAMQIGRTIRQFEDRGASVLLVLTPEHPWLRTREPPGVVAIIQDRLRKTSRNPNLKVLDFRSAVASDGFIDLVHLNSAGSRYFSAILAQEISVRTPTGSPKMHRP